ncbi:carbohydrate kinase family protein [Blautia schinkii]|nr:carbohydrate kinase family protein [Blautia schinkii]
MEKDYDIVAVGMMAYDMVVREVDESLFTRDATLLKELGISSGGGAMTQAVIAKRLGCRAALCSRVGDDTYGQYLMEVLRREGIADTWVQVAEEATMVTIALVKPDGNRNFLTREGDNIHNFTLEDVDLELLKRTRMVSYGSFYFLPGLDGKGEEKIFRTAKDAGAMITADTASDAYGKGRDLVFRNLPYIDYFVPSYEEASYLAETMDVDKMAETFLSRGATHVIIKLGEQGCYLAEKGYRERIPAFCQKQVCDTTGAGDNFTGAFMAAVLQGLDFQQAALFANGAAAVSVTGAGAVSALKDKQQVYEILHRDRL